MQKYLLIAIGGALGSIARYWVGSVISSRVGFKFPYGTLIVNVVGFAGERVVVCRDDRDHWFLPGGSESGYLAIGKQKVEFHRTGERN